MGITGFIQVEMVELLMLLLLKRMIRIKAIQH